jgi:hypothetical protein
MKRRDVLKGAAATAVLPVGALAGAAEKPDYEKKYWEAQRHSCASVVRFRLWISTPWGADRFTPNGMASH